MLLDIFRPVENVAKTLSVVVPVYNEARHLREVIDILMKSPCPIQREWIFVDDCSTDGSREILIEIAKHLGFNLILQEKNQGKGAAVIRGIKESKGQLIMIQDADFEYTPYDVPKLLLPLINGEADVVFGSRFKKDSTQVRRTYHYLINRFLTLLSNLMSGLYLTDMETCYKIFNADLVQSMDLKSQRFGIEVEITAYVAKTQARLREIPIRFFPRSKLKGKKINWTDGVAALWHLIRFNWLIDIKTAYNQLPDRYTRKSPGTGFFNETEFY